MRSPAPDPQRICGLNAVRALFLRRPEAVLRLFFTPDRARDAGRMAAHLARTRRPYREVGEEEIARVAGTTHHGGIVAVAAARFADALPGHALPPAFPVGAVTPVLDGIGNPHNLGAIARGAAFFGCRGLILSDDARQADLSDAVFRVAEGGLEHLAVVRARSLPVLLQGMRPRFLLVAAVASGGAAPAALPRDRPIALILGNEEAGVSPGVAELCEGAVTLPGSGLVESLNVAAAAAVLCYALGASR